MQTRLLKPQLSSLRSVLPLAQEVQTQKITEAQLKQIGLALWHAVDMRQLTPCHLMISSDNPIIHQLPWECLYHPQLGFLGQHAEYSVSRQLHEGQCSPPLTAPLKILLFTAQPRQAMTLATDIEQQYLRAQLQPAIAQGQIQYLAPHDGRFATLVHLLQQQHWDLVLLSGHGYPSEFIFEHEVDSTQAVKAEILAATIQQVSCVVLTACYSSPNLALALHQAGIPQVVGMQGALLDKASQIFISHLCLALSQGITLGTAVQQGRMALTQLLAQNEAWRDNRLRPCADPSSGQWWLPVLFSCDPRQQLTHQCPFPLQLSTPKRLFFGRRPALRTLTELIQQNRCRHLVITGAAGIGKTALAHQLVISLAEYQFHILKYQHNEPLSLFLARQLVLPLATPLVESMTELDKRGQWILWIENPLATEIYHQFMTSRYGRLLSTARVVPKMYKRVMEYCLSPPEYADFLRYSQHLGLAHPPVYIQLMYRYLKGNFRGLQLLQSLPLCLEPQGFKKQLALVQRYLAAYREDSCSMR